VWKLLGHDDKGWDKEHELSLETLWGFQGFGDLPKDLTPMYPVLSTKDTDVIYLVLAEFSENQLQREFFPSDPRYLLALDMRNKIVRTAIPLDGEFSFFDGLIPWGFSRRYLRKALVGPCDDNGIPMKKKRLIPMKRKLMMKGRLVVAEAPIPMKKKLLMKKLGML
jgi:hypothetical protein